jgi:hypothetical protein
MEKKKREMPLGEDFLIGKLPYIVKANEDEDSFEDDTLAKYDDTYDMAGNLDRDM